MSRIFSRLKVYRSFARTAFLNMLAYRLRYYTGIITYTLFVAVYYFIWEAVYATHPEGEIINGFTLPQMITYVAIGWIARSLYHSNIDYEVDDHVRTGQVSIFLLRPVNFQLMMFAQAVGESSFRLILFTGPITIMTLLLFPVQGPASAMSFLLFTLSTFLGFLVLAAINFLTGLMAFSFKSIQGVIRAKYYIVQLLSGLLLPLTFFPGWLGKIVEALPFKEIAYVPLQFYLGKIPVDDAAGVLITQLIWFVVLFVFGRLLWSRALAKLTLQGG